MGGGWWIPPIVIVDCGEASWTGFRRCSHRVTGTGRLFESVEPGRRMNVMNRRGKVFALSAAAVGVVVFVVAGIAAQDWFVEQWYLRRLRTTKDWVLPAERLGDLGSVKAIAYFLDELGTLSAESIGRRRESQDWSRDDDDRFAGCHYALGVMAERMGFEPFTRCLIGILSDRSRDPTARAMAMRVLSQKSWTSPRALEEALIDALRDPSSLIRANAMRALGELIPRPRKAIPVLNELLNDPDTIVRESAAEAIKKIQDTTDEAPR